MLHICCAPCATEVVRRLVGQYEVAGFFYNPNVAPEAEYQRRLLATEHLSALWHVPVDVGGYDHDRFLEVVRGPESEPEGGRRCERCFRLRLETAADRARANGCTVLASTLTVGPNKKASVIDGIGREVAEKYGLAFLAGDWKKQDGFRHSVELSKELGLYRQAYCGCEFSFPGRSPTRPVR